MQIHINVILNGLDKYMSSNINKLILTNSCLVLSSSLDRLVKNGRKSHFKYQSQEFDSNVLDLVM